MKSTVLYHYYGPERRNGLCRSFNTKHCALTSAIYTLVSSGTNMSHKFSIFVILTFTFSRLVLTLRVHEQNISILVVLLYSWQINVNTKKIHVLGDVYFGVQIAYVAIIGSQLAILLLSVVLIAGINSVSLHVKFTLTFHARITL